MVAAHPLAAQAGVDVYKKGGNVVDAAVATAYVLGVVEPHGSGIGGEGMLLYYDAKTGRSTVIDFKAIAPAAASYQNLDFTKTSSFA
nr:gamma-glutamyltransferase [Bacteroidota bacterium]